jgi:soluble lytic murein transglycosylase-like protein
LTAAGLGVSLSPAALGAEPSEPPTTTTTEGSPPPTTPPSSSESGSGKEQGSSTTTTTTPAPTPPPAPAPVRTPAPAPRSPAPSAPAPSAPASGAPAPSAPASPVRRAPKSPSVVQQGGQQSSGGQRAARAVEHGGGVSKAPGGATGPNSAGAGAGPAGAGSGNVALAPQLVAGAGALAAQIAGSTASVQALSYYRVPLFLLPIYQAAAVQYGVPWQILAAINEIETNYGTDLSVSSAGALGWMQFMPATWLQYGVDALNAGYADPYNPVDAVFAAARYLRAAGAPQNLRAAILAYNHSTEYVDSVLLRARLISSYPRPVIASLTGLVDGRPPVTGKQLAWDPVSPPKVPSSSSATAGASAVAKPPAATAPGASRTPGAPKAPAPGEAAKAASAPAEPRQLIDLRSAPDADVVAVQAGRVVGLGASHKLGKYLVLRDIYGDLFTYAGLGDVAPSYRLPKAPTPAAPVAVGPPDHKPAVAASAGRQARSTLRKARPTAAAVASAGEVAAQASSSAAGKVRLFAHPGNPDAIAAAANAARRTRARRVTSTRGVSALRRGSVVAQGTVLGRVRTPAHAKDGHLRFAIRLAGDRRTIDPRAILTNWSQLDAALHPQGAKSQANLIAATASDVFLLSKSQLEREVLSDPGIAMPACSRRQVASGAIDKRALAAIAFLSRSGLKPTVGTLACGAGAYATNGYVAPHHEGDAVALTHINGTPIAGHQGAGSITDTTIRTLLTLQGEFAPLYVVSLMRYPHAPSTLARADHGEYLELVFAPAPAPARAGHSTVAALAAHSAASGRTAAAPALVGGELSPDQWDQLVARIGALAVPIVATRPSAAAVPDPRR